MSTTETAQRLAAPPRLPDALWSLPAARFHKTLLTTIGTGAASSPHIEQLSRLALYLVLEAPAGPPSSSTEFMARLDVNVLARAWSGDAGTERWTGVQGADLLIAAAAPVLGGLVAQCHNAFRSWATDPRTLRWAATAAGIDLVPGSAGYWDIPSLPLPTTTTEKGK
ncbi:hypothetical protein [Nocardia harenae]|uniref:hypothetical protein n=1 Tax=Nocardia harenae TaxID=358707 RepID=UPI0008305C10|nr:hypothetical protein [Nocardia harenae]